MSLIQTVSNKALLFKEKSVQLEARVLELESEIDHLKRELEERNEAILAIKSTQGAQKSSLENHSNSSTDLNDRIDELVREIDACLMHLKK